METVFTISESKSIINPAKLGTFFTSHAPGTYTLVSKPRKVRSLPQNAYYWAVVVPMVFDGLIDLGYELSSPDDAHEIMKGLFLKVPVGHDGLLKLERVKSTAELTTVQFLEYIAQIQQWAAEFLNLVISDPNQQTEMFI